MSVFPPTRLQQAAIQGARKQRSDSAKKGAATRKARATVRKTAEGWEAKLPKDAALSAEAHGETLAAAMGAGADIPANVRESIAIFDGKPRDGFDVANGCPAIDQEATHSPNELAIGDSSTTVLLRQFAALDWEIRLVPIMFPGGIEFVVWGSEPQIHMPLEAVADYLQHHGEQLVKRTAKVLAILEQCQ